MYGLRLTVLPVLVHPSLTVPGASQGPSWSPSFLICKMEHGQ